MNLFFAVIFGIGIMTWLTKHDVPIQQKYGVHFYMEENEDGFSFWDAKLHAVVDGVDHLVELNSSTEEPMCILLEDTMDIDGDGDIEAIMRNVQACGGNAIGDCFFIVKYKGNGYFSVSDNMGSDAGEISIETWNGQTSFVIINSLPNHRQEKLRYIYENGQVKLVESLMLAYQTIEKEIKSSDFHDGKENDTLYIKCDLNCDGIKDTIMCKYWDRWDLMFVEIHSSDGYVEEFHTGYFRIGVLQTKTNGYYDIIADENIILKWNGIKYIDPRD